MTTEQQANPDAELLDEEPAAEHNILDTHQDSIDGQNKCPKCGATDIAFRIQTGKLRCNFCRFEFEPIEAETYEQSIDQLEGLSMGAGAQDIAEDANQVITLKCSSCAAEVAICADEAPNARCHWCRNILSLNNAVPNGSVPDLILPFSLDKEKAEISIQGFLKKRWFFAQTQFKREFTASNIFGVYLPYMIIDISAHVELEGEGEILAREYRVKHGKSSSFRYDANAYSISRSFDLFIDDLTLESSQDKLNHNDTTSTKNIINSILPFDTKNAIKWDANYLRGYHSENRDSNISDLSDIAHQQAIDIACEKARDLIKQYDRGIRWDDHNIDVKGEKWLAALLPVWLYSYQKKEHGKLYYFAVNARTAETMGSVPLNYPRLALVSFIIFFLTLLPLTFTDAELAYAFLATAPCFAYCIYCYYNNQDKRHMHEDETEASIDNIQKSDELYEHRSGLRSDSIKDVTHYPRDRD